MVTCLWWQVRLEDQCETSFKSKFPTSPMETRQAHFFRKRCSRLTVVRISIKEEVFSEGKPRLSTFKSLNFFFKLSLFSCLLHNLWKQKFPWVDKVTESLRVYKSEIRIQNLPVERVITHPPCHFYRMVCNCVNCSWDNIFLSSIPALTDSWFQFQSHLSNYILPYVKEAFY